MGIREQCVEQLNPIPERKPGFVLANPQGLSADDAADDACYEVMLSEYQNDPDPEKNRGYSLEECKREWGLV